MFVLAVTQLDNNTLTQPMVSVCYLSVIWKAGQSLNFVKYVIVLSLLVLFMFLFPCLLFCNSHSHGFLVYQAIPLSHHVTDPLEASVDEPKCRLI